MPGRSRVVRSTNRTARRSRANEHLVHRCIELEPRIPLRERRGICREQPGKVRVLEIPDPIGHAEVAEVGYRNDLSATKIVEGKIGE